MASWHESRRRPAPRLLAAGRGRRSARELARTAAEYLAVCAFIGAAYLVTVAATFAALSALFGP